MRESLPYNDTTIIMDFIYDEAGRPFCVSYSKNGGESYTNYFYAVNAQGDVEGIFRVIKNDETGKYEQKWYGRYVYDAWGNVTATTAAGGKPSATSLVVRNPIRYRGYYYDTETGFYYLQSRYYDPATHRFINADSYASTGQGILGTNMFAYCANNPVNREDFTGNSWITAYKVTADVTVCMADTSGCAPKPYSNKANCYAYAMKLENDPRTGLPFTSKPLPGDFSGNGLTHKDLLRSFEKVKKVINKKVSADAKVLNLNFTEVYSADHIPKAGNWVVAVAYATDGSDIHWWRRNDDGTWSHKLGDAPIINWDESGNPITDPKNCDRGIYDGFLGYYEVGPN